MWGSIRYIAKQSHHSVSEVLSAISNRYDRVKYLAYEQSS